MKHPHHFFYGYPILLFAVSAILIVADSFQIPTGAFVIILRQSSILGLLCLGLSLVILAGGIDLSVGALLSLSSSICSFVIFHQPQHIFLAVLFSLAVCTLCGLLNGVLVAYLHFPAAIVTFSQALIYTGLSSLNQHWISTLNSPSFSFFFNGVFFGIPISAIFFVLLLAVISICMHNTYWGQYLYAIGSNEHALLNIG
ncbi:ABC transporter permease, partial [Butyricicoccus sp.]|uniref:ABC transporter permease n=1 Tax=Butyricicoccus sp. TaxID=2049021 RepID=UPI003F1875DD